MRATEITRVADARVVADRMAKLNDIVAAAGVTDIAEGLALLDESEDVDLMSAMVGLMSAADLKRGLEIARIADELRAASDVTDLPKLPILSAFFQSRGGELRLTAVDVMLEFVGARALSAALSDEAGRVAGMGAEEEAEGFVRLAMSAGLAAGSEELAEVAEGPLYWASQKMSRLQRIVAVGNLWLAGVPLQ